MLVSGINLLKVLANLFARTYVIAMLKLMIQRNDLALGIGVWSFGQVLAMIMLIGPAVEALSVSKKSGGGGSDDEDDPTAHWSNEFIIEMSLNLGCECSLLWF
jgi:hypothetical protein